MKIFVRKYINWSGDIVIKIKVIAKQGGLKTTVLEDILNSIQPDDPK